MKNLKSNQSAILFILLFLFIGVTMNAQMHPPIAEAKTKTTEYKDYFFHTQFDKKHNFNLEKMLSKNLGKRSGLSTKETKIWNRFKGKKVDGLEITVSKGELQIRYDKSGGEDLAAGLKELLGEITKMIYAKDGSFRLEVKGTL